MNELASREQLNAGLLRWALVLVPLVLLLGMASGALSGSGEQNGWYQQLQRPAIQPPGWAFGVVWPILYLLMGLAAAMVAAARGAAMRSTALGAFAVQLILNLGWSPLFFRAHQVTAAFWLILLILLASAVTCWLFFKVRPLAGWLLVPLLAWLSFASVLAWQTDQLNPDAETLGNRPAGGARIALPPAR